VANIRSDINLAIWRGFKEAGITIPFPQRDLHLKHIDAEAAAAFR
jgi:small-conductance mechanosensitive channel